MLAAAELDSLGIVFINLCEADWEDSQILVEFRVQLRVTFRNTIIATGNKYLIPTNYLDVEIEATVITHLCKKDAQPNRLHPKV